ncbi:hypothetical protein WJX72_005334 [[Myrmecia] bisecta]|uniref:HRDC domain-containing protein n=1 Tax=[Myrmecia] bisecta TaxID=41462 RepID=A0AAW1Q3D5_9CHLO
MAGNLEELVSSIRSGQQLDRLQAAINAAKIVNLPAGADYHYYNSFKSYQQPVSEVLSRVKDLLLQTARGEPDGAEALADLDSAHEWVVSALDDSLERVDVAVDAARTQLKAAATAALQAPQQTGSAGPAPAASAPVRPSSDKKRSRGEFQRFNAGPSSGPRPQDQFEDAVDNSNMPFKPRCIHLGAAAAAAAAPAAAALSAADKRIAAHAQRLGLSTVVAAVEVHPLGAVLSTLCYQPWQLEASTPQPPRGLDKAPLTYVDTPAELQRITERLKQAREIAIDLENHHYRSFQGFSCLMQLSTRSEDFIVDTLALRSELGRHFGPIFADVRVVKVLHGADSDILWLQRDFGIYVANMFDTGQAARVLEFPGLGLAYLLQHFCDIKADKKYQLADWRVRPLSPEMLHYARSDTHYLLYIYDRLKEELLAQADRVPANLCVQLPAEVAPGALGTVLERSRRLCLQLYEKELFTETSYLDLYNRCRETNPLDAEQLAVFAGLFAWRDRIARELDESTGYVMSRNTLLKLATRMPSSPKELQAVVGRSSAVIVDKLEEVTRVIAAAREQAPSAAAQLQQQRQQKKEQQQAHTAAAKLQQQQPRGQQQQEQREQMQPAAGDAAGGPELEGDNAEGTQGDTGAEVHPQRTTGAAIRALADQLRAENDANGEFTGISAERQPPGLSLAVANVAATCSADAMAGSAGAQQAKRKAGKKGDQGDWDEQEFLPLAISESYKMPKKRRRGADQRPQGRDADQPVGVPSGLGTQADSPARRSTGRYHNADYGSDHADQLDHQQGVADADALYSSANEAGEGEGEEGSPASGGSGGAPQQAGSAPSNRHASRSSTAAQRAGLESEDESGDDSGPEERALGPCFPRDSPQPEGRRHARDGMRSPNNPNGERRGNQAQHAGDVELGVPQDEPLPFDYAAARAAAPGLDISGSLNRRRNQQRGRGGRGGRSGGRGDRGRGRDRGRSGGRGAGGGGGCKQAGKQKRVFNPYQMDDAETIKGGKRSSVMPRSGNRSMTFK